MPRSESSQYVVKMDIVTVAPREVNHSFGPFVPVDVLWWLLQHDVLSSDLPQRFYNPGSISCHCRKEAGRQPQQ